MNQPAACAGSAEERAAFDPPVEDSTAAGGTVVAPRRRSAGVRPAPHFLHGATPIEKPAKPPTVCRIAGETLTLHAEHAAYWAAEQTLFVTDTHWGKAATFRAAAIPVPDTEVDFDLQRLNRVLTRTGARRLVILGDMLHNRKGRDESTFAAIAAWRAGLSDVEFVLIEGNHDRASGRIPKDWDVRTVRGCLSVGPFVLSHYPDACDEGYVLAGHLHPKVRLGELKGKALKLPCFWFGERVGVLPAFGSLIDGAPIRPESGDRVYVVADDEVLDMTGTKTVG